MLIRFVLLDTVEAYILLLSQCCSRAGRVRLLGCAQQPVERFDYHNVSFAWYTSYKNTSVILYTKAGLYASRDYFFVYVPSYFRYNVIIACCLDYFNKSDMILFVHMVQTCHHVWMFGVWYDIVYLPPMQKPMIWCIMSSKV